MTNFITNNQPKDLGKRLISLIEKSKELKFLVGFFYFSGLKELYEGLKNNPDVVLKVLVGLNVDCAAYGLFEYGDKMKSNKTQVEELFNSIKKSINTETFDNQEFYTQVKYFINLIKVNRLIIRKTFEPNHAKLYIFKLEEKQVGRNQLFITGSSNLTKPGLIKQQEFNVEISDYGFDDANEYFDELWNKAVSITEDAIVKSNLIKLLEVNTLIKEITPFEAYTLVLKNYLDGFKGKELNKRLIDVYNERGYKTYKYQLDAVSQALSIIEQNNGVIIADVVGLGKTIIACAVAYELRKRGIVICPPGLLGDKSKKSGWSKYLEHFHLTSLGWEAFSLGNLDSVTQHLNVAKDVEVVIIDEAHRFRNEDTESYESLKNICRGKTVILLTATPFNNRPSDIFSLLKLFIVPKKSSITLNDNLESKFDNFKSTFDKLAHIKRYYNSQDRQKRSRSISYYESLFGNTAINPNEIKKRAHYLAKEIKNVIEPVTIRRNRLDLQENPYYKDEINQLSVIENPNEWFYELTPEQSLFYDTILKKYFAQPEEGGEFTGAIYRPFTYEVDTQSDEDTSKGNGFQLQQQVNLYDFMRRLLVKRFESSFGAFKQSLNNFRDVTEIARKFIKNTGRYIMDRDLLENIYSKDIEDIEKELNNYAEKIVHNQYPKNHKIYEINKFKYKDKFLEDIDKDIELFDAILNQLEQLKLVNNDPKVNCLIDNVKRVLNEPPQNNEPKRKVVIFSEYLDTVTYLEPKLKNYINNRILVIAGDLTKTKIENIYLNFDASNPEQKDDYDILLGTDRISEGFDLNRAGMVINYDIPWNPVRVIQRVGRINRISKKVFDKLFIINFFPSEKGADIVRSRDIASNKMFLIHNALGEDAKIFDVDEEPSPSGLYQRILQNPDAIEPESFYTKMLKAYEEIKQHYPSLINDLNQFPTRIKVAKKSGEDELLVFIKKARLFVFHKNYSDTLPPEVKMLEDVYERIVVPYNEPTIQLSNRFWDEYEIIKKLKDTEQYVPTKINNLSERAINVLKTLLNNFTKEELTKHFINMLLEDIIDYGTLSDYTLRKIANIKTTNADAALKDIESLKKELGEDYLQKEKEKLKNFKKEIIIAIENRRKNE